MTRYELFLFLHIACVIVWLGAGTTLALAALYAERTSDIVVLGRLGALATWLGPRVFAPATIGALGFGIALVLDGSWTFRPLWVELGLGAFALSFVLNAAVRFPILRRLESDPEGAGRALARLARVELAVLYLTVADMVAKPTGGDWPLLAGAGAVLALAALTARPRSGTAPAGTTEV
jgi:uncharacterized membrane protein